METITLEQIGVFLTFVVGLITGFGFLHKKLKEFLSASLKDEFKGIGEKIDKLSDRLTDVDMSTAKNFLVARISEAESNGLDEIEKERFWEVYKHYKEIGGNGYIQTKVEKLKANGKL